MSEIPQIEEEPFVAVVESSLLKDVCSGCFQFSNTLKRCSKCRTVWFCNEACQRKEWKFHKEECPGIALLESESTKSSIAGMLNKEIDEKVFDLVRMMARTIFRLRSNGHNSNVRVAPDTLNLNRKFSDLMSHEEEIANDRGKMTAFSMCVSKLKYFLGDDMPPKPVLLNIFGKLVINAIGIMNKWDEKSVGSGLYLNLSAIDHSCYPNAKVCFMNSVARLRPLSKDLDVVAQFDKVRIPYTDVKEIKALRQEALAAGYYFHCQCERCSDPIRSGEIEGLKCAKKACPGMVNPNDETKSCGECGSVLPAEKVEAGKKMTREIPEKVETIKFMKKTKDWHLVKKLVHELLSEVETLLHPTHVGVSDVLDLAMDAAYRLGRFSESADFGLTSLLGYDLILPPNHPTVISQQKMTVVVLMSAGRYQEAKELADKAMASAMITFGPDHAVCDTIRRQQCQAVLALASNNPSFSCAAQMLQNLRFSME